MAGKAGCLYWFTVSPPRSQNNSVTQKNGVTRVQNVRSTLAIIRICPYYSKYKQISEEGGPEIFKEK